MNKIYLLAAAAVVAVSAQAAQTQYLEGIESDLNLEGKTYTYNADNTLSTIEEWDSGLECPYCFYEMVYNDKGQLVVENAYQKLNGKYYSKVYTIIYSFDAAGNVATRTNYNYTDYPYDQKTGKFIEDETGHIPECDPEFGALKVFEYDADGKTTKETVYWDARRNELAYYTDYTYQDGKLMETNSYEPLGAQKRKIFGDTYEYDAQGRKYEVAHYQLEEATNLMKLNVIEGWGYHEDGSLDYYSNFSSSSRREMPSFKQVFEYGDLDIADAVLPQSYERDEYTISCSPKAVKTRTNYLWSASGNKLELYDTYYYLYSTERPVKVGINDVKNDVKAQPRMHYSNGQISMGANPGVDMVMVYDMAGRQVKRGYVSPANPTVDLSNLGEGIYTVVSGNAGVLKIRK